MGKFSKFCSESIHRLTDRRVSGPRAWWRSCLGHFKNTCGDDDDDDCCSNFVKYDQREIGKVVRHLPDKENQISAGSPALARITSKICQSQPRTM